MITFKERVYELSFEEDSDEVKVYEEKKNSNILDGFNATFGEREGDAISFYE